MELIQIDNTTVIKSFEEHLDDPENKRILVSAPFGSGKTYFLQEFFKSHQKFLPVFLFPVDYSVSSNEDVLEIIKYDIIEQLFEHYIEDLDLQINDFSNLAIAQNFFTKKAEILPLIGAFIKSSVVGADQAIEIVEKGKGLISKFLDYKEELNQDEVKLLSAFMNGLEKQTGSIRENDGVTELINSFLDRIRHRNEGKEIVLILDDLDRLDPEQIFRLFNIFTAHHDSRKEVNKFGFDKIIFVCDINNIENMFFHRFGIKSNFDGYIDKFYSHRPFLFDHRQFLKEKAQEYLLNNLNLGKHYAEFSEHSLLAELFGIKSDFFHVMLMLLQKMIDFGVLRTRNFSKFRDFSLPNYRVKMGVRDHEATDFPILALVKVLQQFFPRIGDVITAIATLKNNFDADYEVRSSSRTYNWENQLISYSIPLLIDNWDDSDFRFADREKFYHLRTKNEFNEQFYIEYQVEVSGRFRYKTFIFNKVVKNELTDGKASFENGVSNPNPYHFLEMALNKCINQSFVKHDH